MTEDIRVLIHHGVMNNIRTLKENLVINDHNEKMWKIVNGLFDVSKKVLSGTDKDELSEIDFAKLMILVNCMSDLVSVTHLLQIGFFRPAGTILRGVVENASLAVAINFSPNIYERYKDGKYSPTDAITVAKKFIDEIGKLNGLLSNVFTHEAHDTIGRGIRVSGDSMEIMLIPGIDQEQGRFFSLVSNLVAIAALIIGESMEWCLANHLETFTFWDRIDEGNLKPKANELKTLAKSMVKELETLLKD